jgi:alpha-beta hydrolase superfamily lysophospholipase
VVEEHPFVDAHGVEVFARWWTVEDPRGIVVLAHGASEHSGRYDRFARALNAAGYTAAAPDHRGHGRTASATGPGRMGPGGGRGVVDDLHELRGALAGTAEVPVYFFGHSLGSLIGLAYLVEHAGGLAGAVLCGVAAGLDDVAALGGGLRALVEAGRGDELAVDLLRDANAPFEPARTPFDWLSRDPDEVDRYIADPMCGDGNPLTFGFLADIFGLLGPAVERLGDVTCPVLVIAGDQDPAAARGAHATRLAEGLRAAGVTVDLTLYEGARHELLNETNRDEVTADVIGWLGAHG